MKISAVLFFTLACVGASPAQTDMTMQFPVATRFVTAHGRRAWTGGYANGGLEVWAGALQIASDVRPEFRRQGDVTTVSGAQILAKIAADPAHVSRVYTGADFSVEEEIWVPLDQPAILIRYRVRSMGKVQVIVRFRPSLNLMWPAAVGGQDIRWDVAQSGYILTELTREFAAVVMAPGATAHDEPLNDAHLLQQGDELAIALDPQSPQILFAPLTPQPADSVVSLPDFTALQELLASTHWQQKSLKHYADLLASNLQIETPDTKLNRALAWAEIDLDQDWFCNDKLGCGYVAGFGPSRRNRRPQYAWYFAGDGMIALDGAMAAGDLDRARAEIRFIAKYQDAKSGMIWHELSQSAPYLDWENKYPYMFVHVDLTYSYISAVADYIRRSDDREFLREIWPSVQKAFEYGRSLVNDDGLPRIPKDKEGADEQDSLSDELGLSASWILASDDYAFLSDLMRDARLAGQVHKLAETARASFGQHYWNTRDNSAIQGYRRDGTLVPERGVSAVKALDQHLFSDSRMQHILDGIASWRFQSDWGTRNVAVGEEDFNPAGYVRGSVWAVHTAQVARAFWTGHRPETAFQIWSALVPWFWLDSPGHMNEVLAGNVFSPQSESVPEQTWSSAAFLSAAVHGLFGLEINTVNGTLALAPHLPTNWEYASLRDVQMGNSKLTFAFQQSLSGLTVHVENTGDRVHLLYSPAIPLGARTVTASADGKKLAVRITMHQQDEHADLQLEIPHGPSTITVHYDNGIGVIMPAPHPSIGEPSSGMKLTSMALDSNVLRLDVDVVPARDNKLEILSNRTIQRATNARFKRLSTQMYEVTITPASTENSDGYHHEQAEIVFATTASQ